MGILDRFRKQKEDVLPEEVEDYYKSQRRARVGLAWFVGFVTLVITLFVSLGLFYGVRYVYREITGSDETTETVEVGQEPEPGGQDSTSPSESDEDSALGGSSDTSSSDRQRQQRKPQSAPRTGDRLPANGDGLPATGDPGL